MCLIIASTDGKAPDMAIVRNAILNNPHGWGVVSAYNGKLTATKGFSLPSLTRAIQRLNGPYLIHLRYATHGAVGQANCHPFKVNSDCYMVHNGVLRIPLIDSRYSDSWHFAKKYVQPYLKTNGYSALVADTQHFIGRGNKIAYIRRNGQIMIANEDAGTWKDGLWYSNEHSFPLEDYESVWDDRWLPRDRVQSPYSALEPLWDGDIGIGPTVKDLESITCEVPEDCEYCSEGASKLYYHPETCWYVCADCAATLLQEDSALLQEDLQYADD